MNAVQVLGSRLHGLTQLLSGRGGPKHDLEKLHLQVALGERVAELSRSHNFQELQAILGARSQQHLQQLRTVKADGLSELQIRMDELEQVLGLPGRLIRDGQRASAELEKGQGDGNRE